MKTTSIGVRLEPALLDRLDVVATRWSAASPIPIKYDRSTIVRGLMERALVVVEAELGITQSVAMAPTRGTAVAVMRPQSAQAANAAPANGRTPGGRARSGVVQRSKPGTGGR